MGKHQNNDLFKSYAKRLKDINSERRNGFLVLLDIKDSTNRKVQYKEKWAFQTEILYSLFRSFFLSLAPKLGAKQTIIKFMGDGLLVFYPGTIDRDKDNNKYCDPKLAEFLIYKTLEFINKIHEEEEFCGLKLKSVLAYLTGIKLVNTGKSNDLDVLGRGIDFAFRLEKFAGTTHIVLNEAIANAYKRAAEESMFRNQMKFQLICCKKKMRGWEDSGGEGFYLLTESQMITENITAIIPSIFSDNVINELFRFYVRYMDNVAIPNTQNESFQQAMETMKTTLQKGVNNGL